MSSVRSRRRNIGPNHFVLRSGSAPAVTTCNQFNLASDEPYNNVSRWVLKSPFDYESDKIATCIFYAFSDNSLELRQLNIQVLDVNDNRPFFTEGNNNSLSFPEVTYRSVDVDVRPSVLFHWSSVGAQKAKGIVYAFSATDADQVDNNTLNFSFKVSPSSPFTDTDRVVQHCWPNRCSAAAASTLN